MESKEFQVKEYINKNYISKDKIKAKIEEIKQNGFQREAKIEALQSLLEKE